MFAGLARRRDGAVVHNQIMKAASILLLCCLLLPGCALLTVQPAPLVDPGVRPVPCTQSRVAPTLDLVPASLLLLLAAVAVSNNGGDEADLVAPIAGGATLTALPFVVSSIYGFSKTSGCSQMNARPVAPKPNI
jgi:hypothetical protein